MVVICPKCKTRLKVDDEKIAAGGSRFKCPKCSTFLLVKKPAVAPAPEKPIDNVKVLVAHSNPSLSGEIITLLSANGYQGIIASDGIEAMVKAVKEQPFLAIIEVGLPKIYGVEVCKRLKGRPETRGMKFVLISSPYDKNKYRRDPVSFYEADDHIEEHRVSDLLVPTIKVLREKQPGTKDVKREEKPEKPLQEPVAKTPEEKPELPKPEPKISQPQTDELAERARRLARTIISDIYLYNTAKADEAIKDNTFSSVFASEIKEGLKLYDSRIPQEVRNRSDFFKEVLTTFIENKKKA